MFSDCGMQTLTTHLGMKRKQALVVLTTSIFAFGFLHRSVSCYYLSLFPPNYKNISNNTD